MADTPSPFGTPPAAAPTPAPAPVAAVEPVAPVAPVASPEPATVAVAEPTPEPTPVAVVEPHPLASQLIPDMPLHTLLERFVDFMESDEGKAVEAVVIERLKDAGQKLVVSPITGQKTWLEVIEGKLVPTLFTGK